MRPIAIACLVLCCSVPAARADEADPVDAFIAAAAAGDLAAVEGALKAGVDVNAPRRDGYEGLPRGTRWTALHAACERARLAVVRRLIAAGANVKVKEYLGVTPLHWAAVRGPLECVKALLAAGADVNVVCARGDTPLGNAATIEIARVLLAAGAKVNTAGFTPLLKAAKYNRPAMIALLAEHGARLDDPRAAALHWAGKPEAVRALLKAGVRVDLRDAKGRTALHLTTGVWYPKAAAVTLLLAAGADVNAKSPTGSTPLLEALRRRQLEIVRLLLAAGAKVDVRDGNGDTPLALARQAGAPFVKLLSGAGARDDGRPALHRAAGAGDLARVQALLQGGAEVDAIGPGKTTALHLASQAGHAAVVRVLLAAKATVDAKDEQQQAPLHVAASADVAKALIAAGAVVNPTSKREFEPVIPPIYTAVMAGRAEVVAALLEAGARMKSSPMDPGMLVWAAFAGRTSVVRVLLAAGASADQRSRLAEPALHVVCRGAFADMRCPKHVTPAVRLEIAKLLLDKGADVNGGAQIGYFSGATPLHSAVGSGHRALVELLLARGAKVGRASPRGTFAGETALHAAARAGHLRIALRLIEAGADVNARTGKAHFKGVQTPVDMAAYPALAEALRAKGGKRAVELGGR